MQARDDDYEQLIEAVGDTIILVDTNGNIRLWNQAAERPFGFSVAEGARKVATVGYIHS